MKIVVAGATGYLGRFVVKALAEAGHSVRALARDERKLDGGGGGLSSHRAPAVRALCDEVFVGEATDPRTLDGLCDGCDVLFSSLGKRTTSRQPTVWDIDYRANVNVLEHAQRSAVSHVVFVSAINADVLAGRGVQLAAAREKAVDAVKASGMAWTILRPSGFFNDMEEMFTMCAKGTGWLVGDGSMRMNPIHGGDIAAEVVRAVEQASMRETSFSFGGPDVFTLREIYELAFEVLGTEPKLRSIPLWMLGAAAAVITPFNPMIGGLSKSMRYAAELDMSGEPVGEHHLRDFFEELARERAKG